MKRKPKRGIPKLFDRPKYRQHTIIVRMFGSLKGIRRIGTRFDKRAKSCEAMTWLACPCGGCHICLVHLAHCYLLSSERRPYSSNKWAFNFQIFERFLKGITIDAI